jgi:pimeloyl-ACP methyl ester carboxylesterase
MATFVLVHGANLGGWCYQRVSRLLRRSGHEVHTPTLTGLGERAHLMNPSISLDTHIEDVLGLIRWEELADIVLCGHSYGGMVISGVAEWPAAHSLDFVRVVRRQLPLYAHHKRTVFSVCVCQIYVSGNAAIGDYRSPVPNRHSAMHDHRRQGKARAPPDKINRDHTGTSPRTVGPNNAGSGKLQEHLLRLANRVSVYRRKIP